MCKERKRGSTHVFSRRGAGKGWRDGEWVFAETCIPNAVAPDLSSYKLTGRRAVETPCFPRPGSSPRQGGVASRPYLGKELPMPAASRQSPLTAPLIQESSRRFRTPGLRLPPLPYPGTHVRANSLCGPGGPPSAVQVARLPWRTPFLSPPCFCFHKSRGHK